MTRSFITALAVSQFALLSTVSAPNVASGQAPVRDTAIARRPLRIIGTFDEISAEPLAGVEVSDVATGVAVMTSTTGSANLGLIVPNGGQIRLRKVGFAEETMRVSMSPSDTVPITVMMKHVAELTPVITKDAAPKYLSPRLRAFETRRKTATSGYFIDEETLRKEDYRPLSSLLEAHAPGSKVQPASSAAFLLKSKRCVGGGQPDVYLDGAPLAHVPDTTRWRPPPHPRNVPVDPTEYPIDVNQFQVRNLAGVEYYPDNTTMPAEFARPTRACGALFLWTRER